MMLSTLPTLPERGYFKIGDTGPEVVKLQRILNFINRGRKESDLFADGEYGKLTSAAVRHFEESHRIKIDGEFGPKCRKIAENFKMTPGWRAVNWAVSIANDNRFTYGVGKRAHRAGCYFCGTSTGPVKSYKERRGEPHYVRDSKGKKHTYEKTYCCNPFIFAAYAHGARLDKVLRGCRRGACGGMSPRDWTKFGMNNAGKCENIPFNKLRPGDVIISKNKNHVWMYTCGNGIVEACKATWESDSIAHKSGAKKRYETYQKDKTAYVIRAK